MMKKTEAATLKIRIAEIGDLPDIARLEEMGFFLSWSPEMLLYDILSGYSRVALLDGAAVGYASMQLIYDEAHIRKICVDPAYRRAGIGTLLLNHIIKEAAALGAEGVTLEVREKNASAIGFYQTNGFKGEGVRKNYYPDDGDNALIMWKRGIGK